MESLTKEELRGKKRKLKRKIRRTRKELRQMEEDLILLCRQEKNVKQIEQHSKYKQNVLERVRRGEARLTRSELLKLIRGEINGDN